MNGLGLGVVKLMKIRQSMVHLHSIHTIVESCIDFGALHLISLHFGFSGELNRPSSTKDGMLVTSRGGEGQPTQRAHVS